MLSAHARVHTSDASRYVAQLCKHAAAMGEHGPALMRLHAERARAHAAGGAPVPTGEVQVSAEWSATRGVISFIPWGRCTVSADADGLLLAAESSDTAGLRSIQNVVTGDLERWGSRQKLKVVWTDGSADSAAAAGDLPEIGGRETRRRHRLLVTAGALGVGLMVLAHLTLAGVMASVPLWLGWSAAGLMLVPAVTLGIHAVGPLTVVGVLRHALRRTRARAGAHVHRYDT